MFTNYDEAAKTIDIKNALDSIGINSKSREGKYFSDLVGDLCYCMSLNNGEVIVRYENKKMIERMNKVGECLNNPLMTEDQRKIVDDYLSSCRLELANFIYEIGLNKLNYEVDSCARKINKHLATDDVLVMFARSIYSPMPVKKEKHTSKVKKIEK